MYIEFPIKLSSGLFSFRKTPGRFYGKHVVITGVGLRQPSYLFWVFSLSTFNHLALLQRRTSGCEPRRRTATQNGCTSLRGLDPLFYDWTDKAQAGCPTIEVKLAVTKCLLVSLEEVVNEGWGSRNYIMHRFHQAGVEEGLFFKINIKENGSATPSCQLHLWILWTPCLQDNLDGFSVCTKCCVWSVIPTQQLNIKMIK